MKFIIIHSNERTQNFIQTYLTNQWHVVAAQQKTPGNLLPLLVRHQPHGVIIEGADTSDFRLLQDAFRELLPQVRLFCISTEISNKSVALRLDEIIAETAQALRTRRPLQTYASETRTVVHDDAYKRWAAPGQINLPTPNPIDLISESSDFSCQVRTAIRTHDAAIRYLRQALVTDRGQRLEVGYRFVHHSYKIYTLRESIGRWVGVLLHYFPDTELEHLPPPCSLSPNFEFLDWNVSPEAVYAICSLVSRKIDPEVASLLRRVTTLRFEGEDSTLLAESTVFLSGLNALMQQIAVAQVRLFAEILNPASPWHHTQESPRRIQRAEGIVLDFWKYGQLRLNPDDLRQTAVEALGMGPTDPATDSHLFFQTWQNHRATEAK